MAYLPNYDEDEQKRQAQAAGFPSAPSMPSGGAGSAPAPAAAPAPQGTANRYADFGKIFAANQEKSQAMAAKVASGVGKQADEAQQGLTGLQNQFKEQVGNGSVRAPQGIGATESAPSAPAVPGMMTGPAGAAKTAQQAPRVAAAPVGQAQPAQSAGMGDLMPSQGGRSRMAQQGPPRTAAEYRAASQQQYRGPKDLSGVSPYAGILGQTDAAATALEQTKDKAGIQALMGQASPDDTSGELSLDAALAARAGGGQFDALRGRYGDLRKAFGDANRASASQATAAGAASDANAAEYGRLADSADYSAAHADDARLANEKRLKDQEDLQARQRAQAADEHQGIGDYTTSMTDDQVAMRQGSGFYDAWVAAGRPPVAVFKQQYESGGG